MHAGTQQSGGFGGALELLPSGALGEGMRAALIDGTIAGTSLLVLGVWTALGTLLTSRTFTWE